MKCSLYVLTILSAVTVGSLTAQQNIVYHDDTNPAAGNANAFPFGSEGVRIQQVFPGSVVGGPALIQDLFVAPRLDRNGVYLESEVVYGDFEIRMGVAATPFTTSWAANIPNPTVVYRGPLRVTFRRDQWSPLGLPVPFVWTPANPTDDLAIDFILWDVVDTGAVPPDVNGYFLDVYSSTGRTIPRAYRRGWTTAQPATSAGVDGGGIKLGLLLGDGNFVAHGGGCQGSSGLAPRIATPAGAWPQVGGNLVVQLADGPPNSGAALQFGLSFTSLGGIPLPIELGIVGAPGCYLWHDLQVATPPLATDGSGAVTFTLGVPSLPGLVGARLYASWLALDSAANQLGFTTSGYATVILGT